MAEPKHSKNVFSLDRIEVLSAKQSKYINPHRIHYKLNGKLLIWDCMKVHDSVVVIIYNKSTQRLVFVRQFRPAVIFSILCQSVENIDFKDITDEKFQKLFERNPNIGYTIEFCAGIMDKDKSPKQTAREEVEEETGYKVDIDGVGVSASLQTLFYCEVSDETPKGKGGGVDDEVIEVIELTIDEAKKLMYCEDSEAMMSRPGGLLFGLSWFIYEQFPTMK